MVRARQCTLQSAWGARLPIRHRVSDGALDLPRFTETEYLRLG